MEETVNTVLHDKFSDRSKSKTLTDEKIDVTEKFNFDLGRVENLLGKGEKAGYQHNIFKWPLYEGR